MNQQLDCEQKPNKWQLIIQDFEQHNVFYRFFKWIIKQLRKKNEM